MTSAKRDQSLGRHRLSLLARIWGAPGPGNQPRFEERFRAFREMLRRAADARRRGAERMPAVENDQQVALRAGQVVGARADLLQTGGCADINAVQIGHDGSRQEESSLMMP
ncbi:MAG: hypothetical protein M5R42_18480 [Rhodocyclaceae bacterium]|nr:hypothetical protein [Rhodocyclaceae bacterium]